KNFYGDNLTVVYYEVDTVNNIDNYSKFKSYGFKIVPAVVVKNISSDERFNILFSYEDITFENLKNAIDFHLLGNYSEKPPEIGKDKIISTPFGTINVSELSIVVLTIVLAAADSFNPCSFFIFLFLLSILLHLHSRKKMLVVAGVFIFFSGFFYFLIMAALLNIFLISQYQLFISIIAGLLAIVFGLLNIKDFFFFKKGPSLGIADEKKPKLFKQIRKIAQTPYFISLIVYTIVLALTVNTVELLCTLGFPLVFTRILTSYNLDIFQYYFYLVFYNIIYVLPLLFIVIIFVIILKHWKLSEWQGRVLKLYSGTMMFSLGLVLLFDSTLLHDVFSALALLFIDLLVVLIVSYFWKKRIVKPDI
ncbi:MAG: hypothetical protein ACQXXF_08465, partial [Thermoplasmatota archaeon]